MFRHIFMIYTISLRGEVLNRKVFNTLWEAKVPVERWRREYNHIRLFILHFSKKSQGF